VCSFEVLKGEPIMVRTCRPRLAFTAFAGSILTVALTIFATQGPLARAGTDDLRVPKKEEVREAMDHLLKAQSLLSKADHDEKGYDYQALKKTEEAVDLCKKQLGIKD